MKKNLILGVFIALLVPLKVFAFGGCEEDCMKCHTILKWPELQKIAPSFIRGMHSL